MINFILFVWQLPQTLVAMLIMAYLRYIKGWKPLPKNQAGVNFFYFPYFPGGIALGEYIFLSSTDYNSIRHEYGHVLQSRILGPLYLLLIGIPSLIHAAIHKEICSKKHPQSYYHFYTEKWADILGDVYR